MTRTYDRSDLVRVFLAGQNQGFGGYYVESEAFNQALERHYRSVQGGLETLYGLRLSPDGVGSFANKVIFMLFRTTAQSFLAIRTPWSGVIEAGLIDQKLEAAGPTGERVMAASSRISDLADDARRTHLEMLDALMQILLGERADLTFASADLTALGIDDRPPNSDDFTLYEG